MGSNETIVPLRGTGGPITKRRDRRSHLSRQINTTQVVACPCRQPWSMVSSRTSVGMVFSPDLDRSAHFVAGQTSEPASRRIRYFGRRDQICDGSDD